MSAQKGLEWTFDTVAATYEKLRPGYVDDLYRAIFDYIPRGEMSNVVEVGSGSGQASAPMLKTGC
ncbi:MAG: class I SAM-dependent methyltransferase, partial [Clostridia bacterium]|nr:class I SAM-dependent methyltransferase [Clostridia bacterium]